MEIGQILREAREAKQITIDEVQEKTKIQKRYLLAIEQNNFQALPGRFYARAFIKEYALMLDLDPDLLLQNFDVGHIEEEEPAPYTSLKRSRRSREAKSSTIFSLLPTVIVVLLIFGILFIAWTLTQKAFMTNQSDQSQDQEPDEIIRNIDEPSDSAIPDESDTEDPDSSIDENDAQQENVSSFTVVEEGTGNSPESTLQFVYYEDDVIVTFDVTADSYVAITGANGTKYHDGLLQPNGAIDPIEITDEQSIHFNIGNTAGLTVKINDVPIEYPISPSERVHQKLLIELQQGMN